MDHLSKSGNWTNVQILICFCLNTVMIWIYLIIREIVDQRNAMRYKIHD
ncbi:MAG: hypothetical protein WC460_01090 [Patescibacteria group bacterium]